MQSSFRNGSYKGYEVQLRVRRAGRHREPVQIKGADDVYRFMGDLAHESAEYVYGLFLDTQHQVQDVYLVGKGSCSSSLVHPAELYKPALLTNSPAFMMVHNHPSGDPRPSTEDEALVKRLLAGSQLLGLSFLDSLIVGDGRYFSFQEVGAIKR